MHPCARDRIHKTNPVFVDTMRERQRVPLGTAYEVEYECGNAVKTVLCLHRDFKLVLWTYRVSCGAATPGRCF